MPTHGSFENVKLTVEQYAKLVEKFGAETEAWIETLSIQKEAHGYKYKSDFAAIIAWSRNKRGNGTGHPKDTVIPPLEHPTFSKDQQDEMQRFIDDFRKDHP